MKTKTIHQTAVFACSPHTFYEIIMDSKKHTHYTGQVAKVSRKVGGKFTAADEYITGKNLKLVKDKLIVQSWNASDFPKGHMSTVTFKLQKDKAGTKLVFTHEGVPEKNYKNINGGWKVFYWDKIRAKLKKASQKKKAVKAPKKKPAKKKSKPKSRRG